MSQYFCTLTTHIIHITILDMQTDLCNCIYTTKVIFNMDGKLRMIRVLEYRTNKSGFLLR